jgi:cell division protein YceG involved in septum cleavage
LKAALNPAQSDYLYYVRNPARDDGAHNFYNNSRDFEVGVQALRNWEHERDLEEQKQK